MKDILFYTFIVIFITTTVITLLGIIGKLDIREGYLKALFAAFILEVGTAMVGLFKATEFFENPVEDFIKSLPAQAQAATPDETRMKISGILNGEGVVNDGGEQLNLFISHLPKVVQRATPDDTAEEITKLVTDFENMEERLKACAIADSSGSDLLAKLMLLHNEIKSHGPTINFAWKSHEKEKVAYHVLEILNALGYFTGEASENPEIARAELIKYQQSKVITPSSGLLGRKTFIQLFNDYLQQTDSA